MRERIKRQVMHASIEISVKHRCRELEEEKEGVRYFWRNQIMEGEIRSGMLV